METTHVKQVLLEIVASDQQSFGGRFGEEPCEFGAADVSTTALAQDLRETLLKELAVGIATAYLDTATTGTRAGDFLLRSASYGISIKAAENFDEEVLKLAVEKSAAFLFTKAVDDYLGGSTAGSLGGKSLTNITSDYLKSDNIISAPVNGNQLSRFGQSTGAAPTEIEMKIFASRSTHFSGAMIRAKCHPPDGSTQESNYLVRFEIVEERQLGILRNYKAVPGSIQVFKL